MRSLPGTDLVLSPLCLGGNVFGWTADETESFTILDDYIEAGGNIIDTADTYSAWQGTDGGESETIIGKWMRSRKNRDQVIIATKVGSAPKYRDLRPGTMQGAIEESLRRLQTDRIDLYYAHRDRGDPLAPTLEKFDSLVRAGTVRYVAASNYEADRLTEAITLQRENGWAQYVALQAGYNLVERASYEGQLLDAVQGSGIGMLPYAGLARGFLTGKYRPGGDSVDSPRAASLAEYENVSGYLVASLLREIAAARGVAPGAVALAWLLTRPTVVSVLASARNPEQLAELLPMVTLTLGTDELAELDSVSAA